MQQDAGKGEGKTEKERIQSQVYSMSYLSQTFTSDVYLKFSTNRKTKGEAVRRRNFFSRCICKNLV